MEDYVKDKRIPCNYGAKCYQKNSQHHEKYKHPPKKENIKATNTQANKRMKIEKDDKRVETIKINNDVSESESDKNSDTEQSEALEKKKEEISESDYSEDSTQIDDKSDSEEKSSIVADFKLVKIDDVKKFIKEKFLVDMPGDFYHFWDFCKSLKPGKPLEAFKEVGLTLVGPYDVLAGKFDNCKKSDNDYLLHWRFFYDPPEFQTVLMGDIKSGFHIGYWRDDPKEKPVFMVQNKSRVDGVIQHMGENIFAAINVHLEKLKKTGDPFQKMNVSKYQNKLLEKAKSLKLSLEAKTDDMIQREKKIVTRTFNKIGLVVPIQKKTDLGYRELALNNKDLLNLLNKLSKCHKDQESKILSDLQPCFTFASIALDECDFGTGVELGWNIMAHGIKTLNSTALRFLKSSYELLNRNEFAKIAEVHLSNRKEGCNLSIL
ncbi:unnamed protein product [Brassicogethes aeneus]|uniref:PBZ-type domain-containing protein n=1 Tax=Brassicogethes aeneus TaxID=1431903 RepID=A0A9P0FKF5_BRAAE|nr:unnamed protein product [Brassicogethes aeneus]